MKGCFRKRSWWASVSYHESCNLYIVNGGFKASAKRTNWKLNEFLKRLTYFPRIKKASYSQKKKKNLNCFHDMFRSSHTEVFLGIGVLKICSKFTGEIAIRHECPPVNLLHTFRTPFLKSSSGCSIFMNYCSSKIHQHMVFNFKTQKQSKDYSKQRLLQFTSVL